MAGFILIKQGSRIQVGPENSGYIGGGGDGEKAGLMAGDQDQENEAADTFWYSKLRNKERGMKKKRDWVKQIGNMTKTGAENPRISREKKRGNKHNGWKKGRTPK